MRSPSIATSSGPPVGCDRALAHVVPGRAVLHEAEAAVARGELWPWRAGGREFREHRAVRLEAGGVHVGDIVGDEIELALKRGLPRQANEKSILHPKLPLTTGCQPSQAAFPTLRALLSQANARAGLCSRVPMAKIDSKSKIKQNRCAAGAGRIGLLPGPTRQKIPARAWGKIPLTIPTYRHSEGGRRRPRPATVSREPVPHLIVIGVSIHGRRERCGHRQRGRSRGGR